jgi:hypothetical protein
MEIKVTFRPLTGGRYRCLVNGVLGEITKNPKKTRFSLIRANDNKRIQALKEEEEMRERERQRQRMYSFR